MSDAPVNHSLSSAQFEALASGFGDPAAITCLKEGQQSKWMMTLQSILNSFDGKQLQSAIELASIAQSHAPDIFAEVILYPQIQLWAHACLESGFGLADAENFDFHLSQFSSIAAVVAYRCGITGFAIPVPIKDRSVVLPTLGKAQFNNPSETFATASVLNGGLTLSCGDETISISETDGSSTAQWQNIRHISLTENGLTLSVFFDDIDPYRGFYTDIVPVTGRMDDADFEQWKQSLTKAWCILTEYHRDFAVGMAEVLQSITVLVDPVYRRLHTSPYGFGGVALTGMETPEWLAYSLLDATQNAKFQALNDFLPLHYATHEEQLHYAPWIAKAISLNELLEGMYRHPALIAFWDVERQRQNSSYGRMDAELQFARFQGRVAHMRHTLAKNEDITEWGIRLLDKVTANTSRMRSAYAKVHLDIQQLSRQVELDSRLAWRMRNLHPDPEHIAVLADAWIATAPCPDLDHQMKFTVEPGAELDRRKAREHLGILAVAEPEEFRQLFDNPMKLRDMFSYAKDADLLLMDGRAHEAKFYYEREIQDHPLDPEPWIGLALATQEDADIAAYALGRHPEVIHALFNEIWQTYSHLAQPLELALWLFPLLSQLQEAPLT